MRGDDQPTLSHAAISLEQKTIPASKLLVAVHRDDRVGIDIGEYRESNRQATLAIVQREFNDATALLRISRQKGCQQRRFSTAVRTNDLAPPNVGLEPRHE